MASTIPNNRSTRQIQSKSRTQKRKAEVLEEHSNSEGDSIMDQDEDIVRIAKQLAAKTQRQQEQQRGNQQKEFVLQLNDIHSRIPSILATSERIAEIIDVLTQCRAEIQKMEDLTHEYITATSALFQHLRSAQKSLKCVSDMRIAQLDLAMYTLKVQEDE